MNSIGEVSKGLTSLVSGVIGMDIATTDGSDRGVICFSDKNGRICEEVPKRDEIKCDDGGRCSVYFKNIERSNPMATLAGKYGLRSFARDKDGLVTQSITGVIQREDLENFLRDLGKKVHIQETHSLRKIKSGDINPPKICSLNPLSPKCENFLTSSNWHYLGPLKGWVKAKNFSDAIKISRKKKKIMH